ncbi:MAG: hypothetical protein V3T72_13990, partial [Thermoanaerobaculia bacterium]
MQTGEAKTGEPQTGGTQTGMDDLPAALLDGRQSAVDPAAEEEHARALAAEYGLDFVDMRNFRIQNDLFRRVPFDLMLRYSFIPEQQLSDRMAVVMADPTDVRRIDELEMLLGQPVELKVGAGTAIKEILQKSESAQRVLDEATED